MLMRISADRLESILMAAFSGVPEEMLEGCLGCSSTYDAEGADEGFEAFLRVLRAFFSELELSVIARMSGTTRTSAEPLMIAAKIATQTGEDCRFVEELHFCGRHPTVSAVIRAAKAIASDEDLQERIRILSKLMED